MYSPDEAVDLLNQLLVVFHLTVHNESLAFVARPRSKAAGAEPLSANIFESVLDLGETCKFTADIDDHSGQFTRSIQQLTPFYERMVEELKQ